MAPVLILLLSMPLSPWSKALKPFSKPPGVDRPEKIRYPVQGEGEAVVLLVDFSDNPYQAQKEHFDTLVYGSSFGTMNHYYRDVSADRYGISPLSFVSNWLRAPETYSFYVGDSFGLTNQFPRNAQGLVYAACSLADPLVDFSQYDTDGDGYVDILLVVHAGPGAEEGGVPSRIWSHKWQLSSDYLGCPGPYQTNDGVLVDVYAMEPEWLERDNAPITVGVFVHEFGHVLGLPDLYDIDYSSYGIGSFCLMAAGSWNQISESAPAGSSPARLSAWCRYILGWADEKALERGGITELLDEPIPASTDRIYRFLENPNGPDWNDSTGGNGEYFLVENRYQSGYDQGLPGSGLLILHCDESQTDNSIDNHPLVGIMQADNDDSPVLSDLGSSADLWKDDSLGFGFSSIPSSYLYDGNPSGATVRDIPTADSIMITDLELEPILFGKVYSFPNPIIGNKNATILYIPSDTTEFIGEYPYFKVTIFNLAGEKVRILDQGGEIDRFTRRAFWDGRNDSGERATSGVYFYLIESEGQRNRGIMTLIR
ncbi:MAG TPA: M6 family metalloprotease domain-containing protein [bacterium (Candidatus Stahlbacteria)]|nr:M6 family metalloprotease domain-containing protein [Candidatus Stahlbacteria bacterium]